MHDSQRLPRITGEELVKALQKAGFEIARRKGILRLAELDVAELKELLRRRAWEKGEAFKELSEPLAMSAGGL